MTGCPTGFMSANINGIDRCYRFYNEKLKWQDAKEKCGKVDRGNGFVKIKNNLVGNWNGKVVYSNNNLLSTCICVSYLVDPY